jgi:hypothetical protein
VKTKLLALMGKRNVASRGTSAQAGLQAFGDSPDVACQKGENGRTPGARAAARRCNRHPLSDRLESINQSVGRSFDGQKPWS